jgi:hypothetical protein
VAAAFAPGASDLSNVTVLLVEDSPDNQDLVKRILTRKNATVILANNGLEGVELATSRHYDLILMDVQMPVMDGYSATRTLRAQGNRTPIIALTAHALNQVHQRCLDAGCSDYLPKPINSKALIDKVASYARGPTSAKERETNALLAKASDHSHL